jgi:hypothetical protein
MYMAATQAHILLLRAGKLTIAAYADNLHVRDASQLQRFTLLSTFATKLP